MFLWLSLKFFVFFVCLFSLCSNTHMLTHTVRCSKLTRQLSLLKVLKLSNTQVSEEERERKREGEGKNWLRMAEAYGNRKKKKIYIGVCFEESQWKTAEGLFYMEKESGETEWQGEIGDSNKQDRKKASKMLHTFTVNSSTVISDRVEMHHVSFVFVVMSQFCSVCTVLSVVSALPSWCLECCCQD